MADYYLDSLYFPEFSRDEIDGFITIFQQFDKRNKGCLDTSELGEILKYMGQGVTSQELKEIFDLFDADNSGSIDWREFLGIMRFFYPEKYVHCRNTYLEPAHRFFPEFSKEDVLVFLDAFKEFDLDENGYLDMDELEEAFRSMGQGCSPETMKDLLKTIDVDGSGTIEWTEFLLMMRYFYPHKKVEFDSYYLLPAQQSFPEFTKSEILTFVQVFKDFDEDDSGSIDADELANLLKSLGQGCKPEQVQALLQKFDADSSGEIEWLEFMEIMRSFYPEKKQEYEQKFLQAKNLPFSVDEIKVFAQAFREFDEDDSGGISSEELPELLRWMGQGCSPQQVESFIKKFDTDGSGEIEWNEFLDIMKLIYGEGPQPSSSSSQQSKSVETSQEPQVTIQIPTDRKGLERASLEWIKNVTGENIDVDQPIGPVLKSGVLLCKLINAIQPGTVGNAKESKMPFVQMENIANFLNGCTKIGVPGADVFQTVDLYEEKNIPAVLKTLQSLGRLAQKMPSYQGPAFGARLAEKKTKNWSEEQLKKGLFEAKYGEKEKIENQKYASSARIAQHSIIRNQEEVKKGGAQAEIDSSGQVQMQTSKKIVHFYES